MTSKFLPAVEALELVRRGYDAIGSRFPTADPSDREETALTAELVSALPPTAAAD